MVCAIMKNATPAFSTHGIRDEEFIGEKRLLTKKRCEAFPFKLKLHRFHLLRCGAGTGSVSLEMALRADQGQVFAVEKKADAVNFLRK